MIAVQAFTTLHTTLASPIGELLLTGDGTSITGVYIIGQKHSPSIESDWRTNDTFFATATKQLKQYFAGDRVVFDLPLNPIGTEFQRRVWQALQEIPYGSTRSYGALAKQLGNSNASRAVGMANGRNPISIIIPCHRVIGTNGSLTGYGGGLSAKQWLLDHEVKYSITTG